MMLAKAIRFASLKHGQAVDKNGQPFIGHPLRVMARVAAAHPAANEDVLAAAVLHDVFEDTGTDPLEAVAFGISAPAVALALVLTRDESEGYFDYIARVKDGRLFKPFMDQTHIYDWARSVKIEDLGDNLNPQRRVPGMKLPERYEKAMAMLRD